MDMPNDKAFLIVVFPNLANEAFEVVCSPSSTNNCIAYAAGDNTMWWGTGYGFYWPSGINRSRHIKSLIALFEALGYTICSKPDMNPGYQKVALYANGENDWTHASLQMPNGRWRSKLGNGPLIEHRAPESISGEVYGNVHTYMRKAAK